ncbi:MAG: hypothetical protein AB1486_23085 [Planctomycetota bacterium]
MTHIGRLLEGAVLLALLLLYALLLRAYCVPVFQGVDANAYQVAARLFAEEGRFYKVPADELSFVGPMWVANDRGEYYPKYPPFYPALSGVARKLFGTYESLYLNPAAAVLVVLGLYVLGRLWGLGPMALIVACFLALNPVFNFYAINQVSHIASMFCIVWGYVAFFLAARKRPSLFVVSGLLLGYAAGIRYTDVLAALPAALLSLRDWRAHGRKNAALFVSGLALPCLVIAYYDWRAFGSPWLTGYALTGEQSGFSMEALIDNARFYIVALMTSGLGPLFVISLMGCAVVCWRRAGDGLFFVLWIVPLTILYMAYYWAPETQPDSFLRFLLPVFIPALLLAGIFLANLRRHLGGARSVAAALVIVITGTQLVWGASESLRALEIESDRQRRDQRTVLFVMRQVPPPATIFAGTSILNFLDFVGGYELYGAELLDRAMLERITGEALAPGLTGLQRQRAATLRAQLIDGGAGLYHERIEHLISSHLQRQQPVFLVVGRSAATRFANEYDRRFASELVAELPPSPHRFRILPPCKWATFRTTAQLQAARQPEIQMLRLRPADPAAKPAQGELELPARPPLSGRCR